jgi:S-sulfo-L-cysteine synthase (O-acetyl-L-serine-dependent)
MRICFQVSAGKKFVNVIYSNIDVIVIAQEDTLMQPTSIELNENILKTIGNTPLVKINRLNPNRNATLYAKVEGFNPTGSIKDRIALSMIEQAEMEGKLTRGKTIIEPTSGNTGIALAMIGAVKGYNVEIVMSEAVSVERRKMIKAFGGKVTLTEGKSGTDGAIRKARELVEKYSQKYFMPDQFSNEYNKITHYRTTGEEIWKQTGGQIDYFVSAIGTSGTIMGVGKTLKEHNPQIKIVCAHPVKGHYIQGLKNMEEAIVPAIYDPSQIDITIMVETEAAYEMTRQIVKNEGIFVGMSSGAAMLATIEVAKKIGSGTIVVVFPDRGEKYLSTKLFME